MKKTCVLILALLLLAAVLTGCETPPVLTWGVGDAIGADVSYEDAVEAVGKGDYLLILINAKPEDCLDFLDFNLLGKEAL